MDEPSHQNSKEIPDLSGLFAGYAPPQIRDVSTHINAEEMKRIYSLIDRVPRRSMVRQIAEAFLARDTTRLEVLHPVVTTLIRPSHHRRAERQLAVWLLGSAQLTPQQREFAVDTLIKSMEFKLEPERLIRLKKWIVPALILSMIGASIIGDYNPPWPVMVCFFMSAIFPPLYLISTIRDRIASSFICAEAATSLGKLGAPESLDILVASTRRKHRARRRIRRRVVNAASAALIQVLPTISSDQEGQVRAETIDGLCRLLSSGSEDLAVAILRALIHIGNAPARDAVQKLASGEGRAAREPRVQYAALQCLPMIQARISRENDPHVLLRASVEPTTPPDELLRPTREAPVDPMQLLRACADPNWRGSEEEVALILQILSHLQQHGDARAVPYVEQIVLSKNIDARLLNAANACLPVLRAHEELERYSPSQQPTLNVQVNHNG